MTTSREQSEAAQYESGERQQLPALCHWRVIHAPDAQAQVASKDGVKRGKKSEDASACGTRPAALEVACYAGATRALESTGPGSPPCHARRAAALREPAGNCFMFDSRARAGATGTPASAAAYTQARVARKDGPGDAHRADGQTRCAAGREATRDTSRRAGRRVRLAPNAHAGRDVTK